jgi:MerR family transcriptional regulator/heat shock protein HspR
MTKEYWTYSEILQIFQVKERFVSELVEEDIVCPTCREGSSSQLFSPQEMEKLRLAKILIEEMDVNLPGVEVILRMRQNMIDMRKQFDDILEEMSHQLKKLDL